MSGQIAAKPRPMGRIVCDARRKSVGGERARFRGDFVAGEPVRSLALIRNDGMYPHKDIGEPLVHPGDSGIVHESWSFLGEVYYTVGFVAQSVFVIMRGSEMARIGMALAAEV